MTKYLKKSYKNRKSHHIINNNHPCKLHSGSHNLDKHVHKTHNYKDQVNQVTGQTLTLKNTK